MSGTISTPGVDEPGAWAKSVGAEIQVQALMKDGERKSLGWYRSMILARAGLREEVRGEITEPLFLDLWIVDHGTGLKWDLRGRRCARAS